MLRGLGAANRRLAERGARAVAAILSRLSVRERRPWAEVSARLDPAKALARAAFASPNLNCPSFALRLRPRPAAARQAGWGPGPGRARPPPGLARRRRCLVAVAGSLTGETWSGSPHSGGGPQPDPGRDTVGASSFGRPAAGAAQEPPARRPRRCIPLPGGFSIGRQSAASPQPVDLCAPPGAPERAAGIAAAPVEG